MDCSTYWYKELKKRGLKYKNKPNIITMARDLKKIKSGDIGEFDQKKARAYLEFQMKVQTTNRQYERDVLDIECAYFVGCPELGWAKIGQSKCFSKRIGAIQISCPFDIQVLGYIKSRDSKKTERKLHQKFKMDWIRGEWFRLSPEMKEFINHINKEHITGLKELL